MKNKKYISKIVKRDPIVWEMTKNSPHKIDYDTFVFDACLKKIISGSSFESNKTPHCESAWTLLFLPQQSSQFLKYIKGEVSDKDPISFQYLKRIQKFTSENSVKLLGIVCSTQFIPDKEELMTQLVKYGFDETSVISQVEVPNNYPYDKQLSDQWGKKYWPMIWKGNPVIQELNQVRISIEKEKKYLKEIAEISTKVEGELPIVTMFRDPVSDETIIIQQDSRNEKTPITHSIIDCIQQIASLELHKRQTHHESNNGEILKKNYLCLNYEVYTTHEPCAMCVMALIHSRIGKLTYIRSSPVTGSVDELSGLRFGVEKFSGLNWKFDSWKWCNDEIEVAELDDTVFV